jgi:hypothetical protein
MQAEGESRGKKARKGAGNKSRGEDWRKERQEMIGKEI